jgi:hypothetical protein
MKMDMFQRRSFAELTLPSVAFAAVWFVCALIIVSVVLTSRDNDPSPIATEKAATEGTDNRVDFEAQVCMGK